MGGSYRARTCTDAFCDSPIKAAPTTTAHIAIAFIAKPPDLRLAHEVEFKVVPKPLWLAEKLRKGSLEIGRELASAD